MAEERDPQVSAAYRAMGAEEPPRALDEAILAAARHPPAGERRPARSWTRRHAVPLSLAAVLVLSVTVTLRMQLERPGIESPVAQAPAPAATQEAPLKLKAEEQIKAAAEAPARQRAKTEMKDEPQPFSRSMREQAPAAPAAAPAPQAPAPAIASTGVAAQPDRRDQGRAESSVSGALARQAEERTARDADAAARAPQVGPVQALAKRAEMDTAARQMAAPKPAPVAAAPLPAPAKPAAVTPEQELERIALLRRDGRHEEADKALAEFRKRYPEHKIPELMLERVERR